MSSQKILDDHIQQFKEMNTMDAIDARAALDRGLARPTDASVAARWSPRTGLAVLGLAALIVAAVLLFRNGAPEATSLRAVTPVTVGATVAEGLVVVGPALADTTQRTRGATAQADSVTIDTLVAIPDTGQGAEPERTPFQGVPVLELTRAEMLRFGLVPTDDGAEFYSRLGTSLGRARYGKEGSEWTRAKSLPRTWPAPTLPRPLVLYTRWEGAWIMIETDEFMEDSDGGWFGLPRTDTAGRRRAAEAWSDSLTARLRRLSTTLIPIRIRTGSGPAHSAASDVLLWFTPADDVLDRLPTALRSRVESELQRVRTGIGPIETPARTGVRPAVPLTSTSGAIQFARLVIASDGSTALEFSVAQPRRVRIDLLDRHGDVVARVQEPTELAPGVYRQSVRTDGLPPGALIISISTTDGERTGHWVKG